MKMMNIGALTAALLVAGCSVGPDYQRPAMALPTHYKEAKGWTQATPQDASRKGEWWTVYHDATLSSLLRQVSISNQNVASYAAQYREAQALSAQSRAALFPSLDYDASSTRSGSRASTSGQCSVSNSHSATLSASWELDLWGKLRRTQEEDKASAQASQAELANVTLSAQSELAQDYFQLRIIDEKIALYQRSIEAYQRYLSLINNKYRAGSESRATLAQDYQWPRAQLEHAVALLLGRAPADFTLPVAKLDATLPSIPQSLPSALLQRRPDIAYAERNVAATNAAVGVAIAGYYPDLTLSASGGVTASAIHSLLSLPNRAWSLGPALSGTLLDFGATSAKVAQARAAYDASVATYRQTVLSALGEVEDNLVELNTLQGDIAAQQRAAVAAQASARVTRNQYDAGMIDSLDVATTENSSLSEQQSLLSLQSSQWVSSVALIAALGCGWQGESP
ncbi:MAG: efflux transporter outer membrane subunit [Pantoea sp. Pent]|nr:efflux transporter outer membrane subunit [Pantoea sp. Pent]